MSNLMKLIGTVLALLGLALGIMTFVRPGIMDVYGIKLDTAALLLVGGILAVGLGGVMDRLVYSRPTRMPESASVPAAEPQVSPVPKFSAKPKDEPVAAATGLAIGAGAGIAAAKVTEAAAAVVKPAASSVADTISALEQAKADVIKSLGGMDSVTAPAAPPPPPVFAKLPEAPKPPPAAEDADDEDGDLYVLEEKVIRGRPARILSDNTVEAETDEGWMRFEDMEHLNEYLDSAEEQAS